MWKLKDFLEDNVEEKYYLSEKAIGRLIKKNNKLTRDLKNPEVSSCLISGYHKMDGKKNQYITENINIRNNQPFVLVREGTKKGYSEARQGDSINISYPSSTTKRGRVGKGVSQTILTSPNMATLITEKRMFNPYNNKEITDIAPTQTTSCGCTTSSAAILIAEDGKSYMRIRKLTPLECWRLMGFEDEDFYKAKSVGISDSQLYRQARK